MELMAFLVDILPSVGFPILICCAFGWFIYKIYSDSQKEKVELAKQNQTAMEQMQARCKEREDKLYVQLEKQNTINGRFAEIIAQYEVKLDTIQADIGDIKTDIAVIMNK